MVEVIHHRIPGVIEILPNRFGDDRGYFSEVYDKRVWDELGVQENFVQDNHSLSVEKGVLRGLHFQKPPFAQAKLVRVGAGAVFDVAVDIRAGSPTFGQWVGVELSADKGNQLFVPAGFAHAFLTLTPSTHFLYKVSGYYSRDCDRSVHYADPAIGIEWPDLGVEISLSDKDRNAPLLKDVESGFIFGESE